MRIENTVYLNDLDYIIQQDYLDWNKFKNANIIITGGTGHIGSMLTDAFVYANQKYNLNLKLYLIVRNINKAYEVFPDYKENENVIVFIEQDISNKIEIDISLDYVIHCASPTASAVMTKQPMQVINSGVLGLSNLIECAKNGKCKGFIYLSSMEAYGEVTSEKILTEDILGKIDLKNIRNCYPETKRMCEMMCLASSVEYGLPIKSLRLAQTFGPGINKEDTRVFAMMARCALKGEDIVLKTKGESKHPYLYTAQAITAILCVLLNGESGRTYNAANPDTYCSIYEMAEMVCREFGDSKIKVVISNSDDVSIYPKPSFLNLDVSSIQKMGWNYSGNLKDIYERMMTCMR